MDAHWGIFVVDTANDLLRHFSPFGKELESFGRPAHSQESGAKRDRAGVLNRPRAVAVHQNMIYVACGEQRLRRGVQRFSTDGRSHRPLSAFGNPEARYGAPRGICADDNGILVADTLNCLLHRFTVDGRFVQTVNTAQDENEVSRPVAVQFLQDGTVLLADQGDRAGLKHLDWDGRVLTPQASLMPELRDPVGLAKDEVGRIYVLDRDGERVQRLHPDLSHDTLILDLREYLHEE